MEISYHIFTTTARTFIILIMKKALFPALPITIIGGYLYAEQKKPGRPDGTRSKAPRS